MPYYCSKSTLLWLFLVLTLIFDLTEAQNEQQRVTYTKNDPKQNPYVQNSPNANPIYYGSRQDRVRRQDIQYLPLFSGQYTIAKRLNPAPQLQRIGGNAQGRYNPTEVKCYRVNINSENPWECEGNLDPRVEFGSIKISCEGYDYPDDPYVVAGSCGLLYELNQKGVPVWLWLGGIFLTLWIMACIFWCCLWREGYSAAGFHKSRKSHRVSAHVHRHHTRRRRVSISSIESGTTYNSEDADDENDGEEEPTSYRKTTITNKKHRRSHGKQIVINI